MRSRSSLRHAIVRALAVVAVAAGAVHCGDLPLVGASVEVAGRDSTAPVLVGLGPHRTVFVDTTRALGLPTAGTACLVFRDFDRDGRPDLLLSVPDNRGRGTLELWANRGASFERHALNQPTTELCTAADFDADGWLDVAVPGSGASRANLVLLRNTGTTGFEFEDVSSRVPNPIREDFWIAAFADLDGDGWLDIVMGSATLNIEGNVDHCDVTDADFQCYLRAGLQVPAAPVVLHSREGTSFELQSLPSANPEWVNSIHALDWDDDGRTDLLLSVDFGRSQLLHNRGSDLFDDRFAAWGTNPLGHGMGAAIADYDLDGRWDYYHSDIGMAQMWFGTETSLEDRAGPLGIRALTATRFSWSPLAADFDNDGHRDILVVNSAVARDVAGLRTFVDDVGGPQAETVLAPLADDLFVAEDTGGFAHTTIAHRPRTLFGGTGVAALADYDGDGRIDVAEVIASPAFEFRLIHNVTPVEGASHWLGVRLHGLDGNVDAVGATMSILDGSSVVDRRPIAAGGLATGDAVEHIGLGARTSVSSIRVHWPAGRTEEFTGPFAADRVIELTRSR